MFPEDCDLVDSGLVGAAGRIPYIAPPNPCSTSYSTFPQSHLSMTKLGWDDQLLRIRILEIVADVGWIAVTVTIRDNGEYVKVLIYSYDTSITGWGPHLKVDGKRQCRVSFRV